MLTVTGVAQVKFMSHREVLQTAAEQFLGKRESEIKSTILRTLDGHLRAILGTMYDEAPTLVKLYRLSSFQPP